MTQFFFIIISIILCFIPIVVLYFIVKKFLAMVHDVAVVIDRQEEIIDLLKEIKEELKQR